jgi:hypothetical protein
MNDKEIRKRLLYLWIGTIIIAVNIGMLLTGLRINQEIDIRHALEFVFLIGFGVWISSKGWKK